ncbi:recombinase family protein [Candidatus Saccharibacteria bacterium]|nr:recombinase family protein [Candidatus Saccharibacteria bacterium]
MNKQDLAIASCRVSSTEQLDNNSLGRQAASVQKAAEELGVPIVRQWSGSVSSKRGNNLKRKDIDEMIEFCKKNKRVKYLIVDEPDRFMRSVDEGIYFEVVFSQIGVKVWYASDPVLNGNNLPAKLLKFSKYFSAEGSNEERQSKSISGQRTSLKAGRWPYQPKAGYLRGYVRGVPEIDPVRGLALQRILLSIVNYEATPTEALKELNRSEFVVGRAKYKMDKFRSICTDSFYAGVVEMNKQVQYRNENGLHRPLITMEQHLKLIDIFTKKKKTQSGPRKNGNPDYPLSNIVHCKKCLEKRNGRFVGFDNNNGVNKERVYHRYRCRGCGQYFTKDELHEKVSNYVGEYQMTEYGRTELIAALSAVWKARRKTAEVEKIRLASDITSVKRTINDRVEAAINPDNKAIKDNILKMIENDKVRLASLEEKYENYVNDDQAEKERFIAFALEHAENLQRLFIKLPKPRLLQCKQMLFPAGFWIDGNRKVYTPEMSILTRLASNKKDLPNPEKSFMVRVQRL